MKYEVVLFDLDGTITDTGIGITDSLMYALKKMNIEVKNREELFPFIGPPLAESFRMFYQFSDEQIKLATQYYREHYGKIGIHENQIYDGMEELLKRLKEAGAKLAVATSKPEPFAVEIIDDWKLTPYFSYIAGSSVDGSRRSKADVIEYALENCGVSDKTKVVIIGDRKYDIYGAKQAGIDSIGILFGYGDRAELEEAGATYIAENMDAVYEYIIG